MTWKVNRLSRSNNDEFLTECFGDEAIHYLTKKQFKPPFVCGGLDSKLVSIMLTLDNEVRIVSLNSTNIQLDAIRESLFNRFTSMLLELKGTEIEVVMALPNTIYAIYTRKGGSIRFAFVGHKTLENLRAKYEFIEPTGYKDQSPSAFIATWNLSGFPAILVWDGEGKNEHPMYVDELFPRWIGLNALVDFATQAITPPVAKEATLMGEEIVWYWVFHGLDQIPSLITLNALKRRLLERRLYKYITELGRP